MDIISWNLWYIQGICTAVSRSNQNNKIHIEKSLFTYIDRDFAL